MQPPSTDPGFASAADLAACRAALREGSRTFFAASLLLPRSVCISASALYAFCRVADDAVDLHGGQLDAVTQLRERLARAYDGKPLPTPTDRAFADVVARFGIPKALPEALLEGFEWDATGRRYEDLSQLHAYAARVAGTVGAMMAMLMHVRSPDAVARACDLGVAMQLSNIARDVGEDARAGRLYLPLQWLREAGIDPDAWLHAPVFTPALGSVVQRVLKAADVLYARVDAGIVRLPPACRPGINAARLLYAEIGREVERAGLDSVSRRAVVPARIKAWVVMRTLATLPVLKKDDANPPLEETRFLVEAVTGALARQPAPAEQITRGVPWRNPVDRIVWVIDLFERLERREQVERVGGR